MDFNMTEEEKRLAIEVGPIKAMGAYRDRTSLSLGEAKKVIEAQCPEARVAAKARLEEARRREREEIENFKNELFKDLGIETNPKRELLWNHAWDRGHSSGLHEVRSCAEDLADLIR